MQIQINTDRNIQGSDELIDQATSVVESTLSRVSEHITHLTVRLTDENSDKKGGINDIRCVVDADLKGRRPIAVTEQAATWEQALSGATGKLINLVDTTLGRQRNQDKRRTDPPPPGAVLAEDASETP